MSLLDLFRRPDPGLVAAGVPRSGKWAAWLKAFLKGKSCIACGQREALTGHHVVPYHIDPSRECDPTNVVPMCGDRCHLVHGHFNDYSLDNPTVREDCAAYNAKRMAAKRARGA
jgi:hypothetical protein